MAWVVTIPRESTREETAEFFFPGCTVAEGGRGEECPLLGPRFELRKGRGWRSGANIIHGMNPRPSPRVSPGCRHILTEVASGDSLFGKGRNAFLTKRGDTILGYHKKDQRYVSYTCRTADNYGVLLGCLTVCTYRAGIRARHTRRFR